MSDGRLVAIARRGKRRAPMQEISHGEISAASGLDGDHKGARFPNRQITVLAQEDWLVAISDLGIAAADAPWTIRRANLLLAGLRLPRAKGAVLRIGPVTLEITGQTYPCSRMEHAMPGLLKALARDWRGGVTARVLAGGIVHIGDCAEIVSSPPEHNARLP